MRNKKATTRKMQTPQNQEGNKKNGVYQHKRRMNTTCSNSLWSVVQEDSISVVIWFGVGHYKHRVLFLQTMEGLVKTERVMPRSTV